MNKPTSETQKTNQSLTQPTNKCPTTQSGAPTLEPYTDICATCNGVGKALDEEYDDLQTCPHCEGEGWICDQQQLEVKNTQTGQDG